MGSGHNSEPTANDIETMLLANHRIISPEEGKRAALASGGAEHHCAPGAAPIAAIVRA